MSHESEKLSRRFLLQAFAALAGSASFPALGAGRTAGSMPELPPDFGRGRGVAIIGAGVAGLTAAWVLAGAGFKVTVYEADGRYGGRSLSPRPIRKEYQDWWFAKYDPDRRFPEMYVSEYREDPDRSPDAAPQICRFDDPAWDPQSGKPPVELFLNAGPGRIPSNHDALIDLCRRTGVALEPYIFKSNYNLLQGKAFHHGAPIAFNQVNYSLIGQIAEMLAGYIKDGHMLGHDSIVDRERMLHMLKQFGDLDNVDHYHGTSRLGYRHNPGGWRDAGIINPVVPLEETLSSGFVGDVNAQENGFLFNADNILWQASLLQPVGGMDRIWQQLLLQEVPKDAVHLRDDDPRAAGLAARDAAGRGVRRYLGDLVLLNHKATGIHNDTAQRTIRIDYGWSTPSGDKSGTGFEIADFCISTMAPGLLADLSTSLPQGFRDALRKVKQVEAIKVGWQARSRFWETEANIYGGISWTDDIISQIWYPSEDFNAGTGVLTGAYNRGPMAARFGKFNQSERLRAALAGGEKLHPGFRQKVYDDKGMTIAWQFMPHQVGGWAAETWRTDPETYHVVTTLPRGRLYLAGDAWSHLPGWQEGAVKSAYSAINAMAAAG